MIYCIRILLSGQICAVNPGLIPRNGVRRLSQLLAAPMLLHGHEWHKFFKIENTIIRNYNEEN